MSTMYQLTVTVPDTEGDVTLQDTFPAEGLFVTTILPGTSKVIAVTDTQFGRIQTALDALVAGGRCQYTVDTTVDDPLVAALGTGGGGGTVSVPGITRTGINLKTLGAYTAVLTGSALKLFVPLHTVITCTSANALVGDAEITIGTTLGGTEILPATPITDVTHVGESTVVGMLGKFDAIAGNATIYYTVTKVDTGVAGIIQIKIEGTTIG